MEGGRPSSTAPLLLLALMLAASTAAAAAAQHRQPSTYGSYTLIAYQTNNLGDQARIAFRADGSSIAGFANNQNDWFAIQGSEDLVKPLRKRYGGGGDIPGHDLVNLLGAVLK